MNEAKKGLPEFSKMGEIFDFRIESRGTKEEQSGA